jgi:hypothetical protein
MARSARPFRTTSSAPCGVVNLPDGADRDASVGPHLLGERREVVRPGLGDLLVRVDAARGDVDEVDDQFSEVAGEPCGILEAPRFAIRQPVGRGDADEQGPVVGHTSRRTLPWKASAV